MEMSSKRRIRRKSCTGKVQFPDLTRATAASIALFKNKGERVGAYRCRFCKQYHIGHKPGSFIQLVKGQTE